jgi:hypothetical protein
MGIHRIAAASAIFLMLAGTGLAISPPAHALTLEGYDCTSLTLTDGPRAPLNLIANGTDCTAVNGAPTSGVVQDGVFAFSVDGATEATCTTINADSYPATVLGARCSRT